MSNYSELKQKLEQLPKGYLSKKNIQGKTRYYLQCREGNRIISHYVKESELTKLIASLKERKQIEEELKKLSCFLKPITSLSENALALTGDVMEGDDKVASFLRNELTYLDQKRAPSFFLKTPYLSLWLEKRSIDNHRTNSRLLRKVLRIKEINEVNNVLKVHAVCLTDNYWFRPLKSKLKYQDVVFNNDYFSETALNGDLRHIPEKPCITPELSNTGSLEKCWKLINNHWYMIKKGSPKEVFAELFTSSLAIKLGIPSAHYSLYQGKVITENFASNLNLEPISAFAGDDDSYENVYAAIKEINESFLDSYLLLMWFDALCDNVDRHNENLGILRERGTGRILSLAPNFDNNLSLYSLSEIESSNSLGLIHEFEQFIQKNSDARRRFLSLRLPSIHPDLLVEVLNDIDAEYRNNHVIDFILKRYQELTNFKNNLQ